jgi:uncharacterized protein YaaR (DUF327 family)
MKIHDSSRKLAIERPIPQEKQSHSIKHTSGKQQATFQEELQMSQKKQLSQKLKTLLIEIDEQGKKLVKLPTMNILSQYRDLIKQFLKEVVQHLYHAEEDKRFSGGKQKVLVVIKSVNKALEDLVKMVLNRETNNLKLLDKVGEIKGMLIDLYS